MSTVKFPAGYQQVMPYFIVDDAEGFMKFMMDIFGATEKMKVPDENGRIIHAEVFIGESALMFGNSTEQFPVMNSNLFIYVANADDAYNKAMAAGSISVMEPRDQDYGRSSGITDPYGNTWWITSI